MYLVNLIHHYVEIYRARPFNRSKQICSHIHLLEFSSTFIARWSVWLCPALMPISECVAKDSRIVHGNVLYGSKGAVCGPVDTLVADACAVTKQETPCVPTEPYACPRHGPWATCIRLRGGE
jgi:hypothetical protein